MHAPWPADFQPSPVLCITGTPAALTLAFAGEDLLLSTGRPASAAELHELPAPQASLCIGQLAAGPVMALRWGNAPPIPPELEAISLRQAFGCLPPGHWELAARAKQLLSWDLDSRFCGRCGTPTQLSERELAKHCPACLHVEYPRIAPAIMCLVRKGNELLLARSARFKAGMYSALAGFVESGESVEDCVHREVFEETGIRVHNLRWFASQAWPYPNSLMLAFHADYLGGEITPQADEIEDARWFPIDRLPALPAPVSIAARLIAAGIAELRS